MLCLDIGNIAIITVKSFNYLCIIHEIGKSEANNLLKHSALDDHGYILKDSPTFQST